jgi:hypothetical protein
VCEAGERVGVWQGRVGHWSGAAHEVHKLLPLSQHPSMTLPWCHLPTPTARCLPLHTSLAVSRHPLSACQPSLPPLPPSHPHHPLLCVLISHRSRRINPDRKRNRNPKPTVRTPRSTIRALRASLELPRALALNHLERPS